MGASLVVGVLATACGGPPFATAETASSGGTSGGGGAGALECQCGPGQYCQDGTGPCRDCADRSRFQFGAPRKLAGPSERIPGELRFPRPAGAGLVYRADGNQDVTEIWYSADPAVDAGVKLDGPGVRRSGAVEGATPFAVYFDAEPVDTPGTVELFGGEFDPGARVLVGSPLPPPFNAMAVEQSVAVANGARRAWWMRGIDATQLELVTASLDGGTVEALSLTYGAGCSRTELDDATPYASSDGRLLLFSALARDERCTAVAGKDLFLAATSPSSGIPAPATPLAGLNSPNVDEVDPALSADECVIYFSSDRDTGRHELFEARRW